MEPLIENWFLRLQMALSICLTMFSIQQGAARLPAHSRWGNRDRHEDEEALRAAQQRASFVDIYESLGVFSPTLVVDGVCLVSPANNANPFTLRYALCHDDHKKFDGLVPPRFDPSARVPISFLFLFHSPRAADSLSWYFLFSFDEFLLARRRLQTRVKVTVKLKRVSCLFERLACGSLENLLYLHCCYLFAVIFSV